MGGFTAAGLILIIYSSSMEIQGAMHEFAIPVVHILEVVIVLWVANKMIKYDEQEKLRRFIGLSSSATFPLPWTGRFDFAQNFTQR